MENNNNDLLITYWILCFVLPAIVIFRNAIKAKEIDGELVIGLILLIPLGGIVSPIVFMWLIMDFKFRINEKNTVSSGYCIK